VAKLNPQSIENRSYGVIPLTGGSDFETSKALVEPGTLRDVLNYEVTSQGYDRSQGLLLYGGTYDAAVENMWFIGETEANSTLGGAGSFTLGGEVRWDTGTGTCIYWFEDGANSTRSLGLVEVSGTSPDLATTFYDIVTGTTFTLNDTRRAQKLEDATYAHDSSGVASTVTDYLTFINGVNTSLVASASAAWPYYKPYIPGTGAITGGFQFKDNIYCVRDYMGVGFQSGSNRPDLGNIITIDAFTGKVADVVLEAGAWEAGTAEGVIYLEPSSTGSNSETVFNAEVSSSDTITNTTLAETVGDVLATRHKNKGQLWKAQREGWSWIDLGHSIRFDTGTTQPNAQVLPIFVDQAPGFFADTGYVDPDTAVAVGDTGVYSAWNNVANVIGDDAAVADSLLSASGESQIIEVDFSDIIDSKDTKILGIEVDVECRQTVGTDVNISELRLINTATGAQYQSDNVADNQALDNTLTSYTFGGSTDLWGMVSIEDTDINAGDLAVRIQFQNTNGGSTRTVEVDYIKVKVHYIARGQVVYLNDGSTDVTTADLYAYDKHSGVWGSGTAAGYMTLHNVSDPTAVVAGLSIYTRASGGGDLIAKTTSNLTRNMFPSEAELDAENSRHENIEANFYEDENGNAIYGATGAGPAYQFDDLELFASIRTPVAPHLDKPRHVAFHKNHLALSIDAHILVSSVGSPNVFDTSADATTWPVRDNITGLIPVSGEALGAISRESTHALLGTSFVDFSVQNIKPNSGGIEYTDVDIFGPMYSDFNGITTLETTQRFGNFLPRPLTDKVSSWVRDRFQRRPSFELLDRRPVAAVPVRSKNQYRVYFGDGYILNVHVPVPVQSANEVPQPPQAMIGHLDPTSLSSTYVPTWIDSSVLSTGRERIVMGTADGSVWIVDGANGIQDTTGLNEVECYFTLNPVNGGFPQGAHQTYSMTLHGDFLQAQTITTSVGKDYLDVAGTEQTKTVGQYTDAPIFEAEPNYTDVDVNVFTDGLSLKVQTSMDGSKPHKFHTITHRFRLKGAGRDRTQSARG
jgi:hypothetical protein